MKIIHTSDWHLGQEFYTYDRTEEHEAFLSQLRDIADREQPDALAICGDIYHTATPSNSVMRFFTDWLDRIRQACPQMQIIVTAGNHDSSSRLEITRSLWAHLGVTVIGRIEKKGDRPDIDRMIVPIYGKDGRKCGYVIALPHIFPNNFPPLEEDAPREGRRKAFMSAIGNRIRELNSEGLPVVMTAHLAIAGSDMSGHETQIGGLECTAMEEIAVPYDYLALGHIHFPQTIHGGRARYCGSPLPVSFDEHYPHSVSSVIVEKDRMPQIHTTEIINPWPVKTIPGHKCSFSEAIRILREFPAEEKAYIRVRATLEDVPPANAMTSAAEALAGKKARFCTFKWDRSENNASAVAEHIDADTIRSMSPVELAAMYYRDRFGTEMGTAMRSLMEETVRNINQQ